MEEKKIDRGRMVLLIIMAGVMYALSVGVRMNYGIILQAFAAGTSIPYANLSTVLALSELVYGVSQPLFGALALRKSNTHVLGLGVILITSGIVLTGFARSIPLLVVSLGLLTSAGTGAISFGIVMGAITPILGQSAASAASGIINAASGVGASILSPVMQSLFAGMGITGTMITLGIPEGCVMILVILIARMGRAHAGKLTAESSGTETSKLTVGQKLGMALKDRNYIFLMMGFGTCGFHMSLIQNHLYSQFVFYGIPEDASAKAYTMFGLITIIGALLSGFLCLRFPKKNVLGTLYAGRVAIVVLFIFLMPKNFYTMAIFAGLLGLTGDATVTPTSEIIGAKYGAESIGLLFGITFLCHQIGATLSTWGAGALFDSTGSYQLIWIIDILLCAMAATVSYMIREK